jgi:hypothetical protein
MSVPFFFREAQIIDVDTERFTCSLMYGDLNTGEISHGVPMPNLIGAGNGGFISNLLPGTRVIAAYLHDTSRETVVIIAVLPSELQKEDNYNSNSNFLMDKNKGTKSYPKTLRMGDTYISAHNGPYIKLKSDNSLHISSKDGNGIFLIPNQSGVSNLFQLSNNHSMEGSGGRLSWGRIKRSFTDIGWSTIREFNTDLSRDSKLREIGFWQGEDISNLSTPVGLRNPALSEYKLIINEMATEFGFSGFDKELEKIENSSSAARKYPNLSRDRESGNSLRLSEGELIEIIGGNLADINGLILDLNYNPVSYSLMVPSVDRDAKFEEAFRKSRRGIGYHFKLSTNSKSNDVSTSLKDFVFDIDKEGILKVNIPKSTGTGNIPYVTDINFQAKTGNRILGIASANPTIKEKIPVNIRDREGKVVDEKPVGNIYRETGVRFANTSNDAYFPISDGSGKSTIRINTTKHHNIYAAAERLIANYVREIQIPAAFSREKDLVVAGLSLGSIPEIPSDADSYSRHSTFEVRYQPTPTSADANDPNNKSDIKNNFYSTVAVSPESPAISTGGDTAIAGNIYSSNDALQPLISNYFKTESGPNGVNVSVDKSFPTEVVTHGGVSSNMNLEGSLELSVGKDDVDNKSIVLDTAGSLVMWLGKDKNNRSMIFQSDGDVLVNVGGSYDSSGSNPTIDPPFNPGRFDLRVNVVDKGFHDSTGNRIKSGNKVVDEAPFSSDYLISISEHGLVISGMKAGAPMVIRNDGPVMMESASDKLILKGMQVEIVEFGKLPTDDGRSRA